MATINIADLATELNTDPRTARKFMRSVTPADAQPGKGSRWSIEKREVRSLKSKFAKFAAEAEADRLARQVAAEAPATPKLTLRKDDDVDPSPADLDAIEAGISDDEI